MCQWKFAVNKFIELHRHYVVPGGEGVQRMTMSLGLRLLNLDTQQAASVLPSCWRLPGPCTRSVCFLRVPDLVKFVQYYLVNTTFVRGMTCFPSEDEINSDIYHEDYKLTI